MARAAIDIGSNTILLTIVSHDGQILHDEARVVGLGRGLGDHGLFAPDRIAAAARVVGDYAAIARSHGLDPISIKAVATSAARRAMNAETVFERLQRQYGVRVRIISGDEEARLTWLGAQRDLPVGPGPQLVIDVGGGSTELALGVHGQIVGRKSLELGSARLMERFLATDDAGRYRVGVQEPLEAYVDAELARYSFVPTPQVIIAVAGTATTLATHSLGLDHYHADMVHGSALERAWLRGFVDEWTTLDRAARLERVPFAPERVEFLLAGATVLERALAAAGSDQLMISDRGLRFGLLE